MISDNLNIIIRELSSEENVPYNLLLLADPEKEMIDEYLESSRVYVAILNDTAIGAYVLYPLSNSSVEIKNIAVKEEHQNKGIGKILLSDAIREAKEKRFQSICIGTANSSIAQLYLYQKAGFEVTAIKRNFFIDNYALPIYENGIQAKHMIMLSKEI